MIYVGHLKVGSRWQKPTSKKKYEVMGFAIDTTTNLAHVLYRKLLDDGMPDEVHNNWLSRPISEFLGTVLHTDAMSSKKEYVPRFVPLEEIQR